MKAIGLFGQKYVNVDRREYELGSAGPNEAIVEVRASGVCGTDLNFLRDSDDGFHPLGHELSGVVVETGGCVRNVKPGDKVVAEPAMHFRQAIDLLKARAVDPDVFLTDYVTFDTFEQKMRDVIEQKIPAVKVCLRPNSLM